LQFVQAWNQRNTEADQVGEPCQQQQQQSYATWSAQQYTDNNTRYRRKKERLIFSVSDPDPDWVRIQSGQWIRIRIQEGKIACKNRKN
jgi:hypothetical protein